tara:strand:+ start:189 stop:383 length:195 start_codon:yes stop_codon:yes gene_type:complete
MYRIILKIILSIPSLRERLLFSLGYNKWGNAYLKFTTKMVIRDKEIQASLEEYERNGIKISDFT